MFFTKCSKIKILIFLLFVSTFITPKAIAEDNPKKFEGVYTFEHYGRADIGFLQQFLPYNPIIIEAGAYQGVGTVRMAKMWPRGVVYAFEPNPRAYEALLQKCENLQNVKAFNLALAAENKNAHLYLYRGLDGDAKFESSSSLLKPSKEISEEFKISTIKVQCVNLDDWCADHKVKRVDILRVQTQGTELSILKSSPNILRTAKIIYVDTYFHPSHERMTKYEDLKKFLEKEGFVLLGHWYQQGREGDAIFLSRELYNAYFNLSLGMGI